jgi:hypothetical protein
MSAHSTDGGPFAPYPVQPFGEGGDDEQLPPIPVGPFIATPPRPVRPAPTPQEGGPSEQARRSARGAGSLDLQIVRNIRLKRLPEVEMPVSSTLQNDDGSEQSVATSGRGLVLYTTNVRDAFSVNGGRSFSGLDPTTIFPNSDSNGEGGLCCDQVVTYVPSVDRFVWVLQYNQRSGAARYENFMRVATATSAELLASSGTRGWQYYDFTPSYLGAPGTYSALLDRPHVAFSRGMLYLTAALVAGDETFGNAIWRFPLAQLGAGTIYPSAFQVGAVSDAATQVGTDRLERHPYAPAQNDIFNNPPIQYFASLLTTSSLSLVEWPDRGEPASYEVAVPSIATENNQGQGFDGPFSDWSARYQLQDGRVVTGALAKHVAWFGWNTGRDALTDGGLVHMHDQPAVEFVGISTATLKWVDYDSIEYSNATTVNPQIRVNGEGVLGVDFMFGGPLRNPSYAVGFLRPDYAAAVASSGDVADPSEFEISGDYFGLAADPEQRNCFVAAGSAVKMYFDGILYNDPHYVQFGRTGKCRVQPITLSDLVVTSVTQGGPGFDLSVSGAIDPAVSGAQVYVDYTPSAGKAFSHSVLTDAAGRFFDTATVASDQGGRWTVAARWFGKDYYIGAQSDSFFIDVTPTTPSPSPGNTPSPSPGRQQASLTLVCPPGSATTFPTSMRVTGSLTPAVNASTVVVTYTPPSGSVIVHTVQTAADGSYSDDVVVNGDQIYATWTVQAHFDGDATRTSADAPSCTFSPHYP